MNINQAQVLFQRISLALAEGRTDLAKQLSGMAEVMFIDPTAERWQRIEDIGGFKMNAEKPTMETVKTVFGAVGYGLGFKFEGDARVWYKENSDVAYTFGEDGNQKIFAKGGTPFQTTVFAVIY